MSVFPIMPRSMATSPTPRAWVLAGLLGLAGCPKGVDGVGRRAAHGATTGTSSWGGAPSSTPDTRGRPSTP